MTYLVLARKWRPRSFDTLVGQDHVVRALTHALSTQRLHHAWLFTGTRGVGKTTLSRILAKSLNCESGITATPCGVCQACTEIDSGRFVDYLELDAASNRGVDEMTQLLEQAVYSPSVGRFKVYMIDEVHMLTGHAFNAMLKTLEEPPPHVKFILATTDPQKIPVTVLSRCLQFNLKQMTAESIVAHLQHVLQQEGIECQTPALRLLAQAAAGSMRDALSLTDQAIAYSAGHITTDAIQGMLGTIDQRHLLRLLQALSAGQAREVLQVADDLAMRGLSYSGALADLAVLLSRIAIEQRVGGTIAGDDPLSGDMAMLARDMHPDLVQLFYSIAVHSRQELALAPDEYAGFVMACLRMLAVVPAPASGDRLAPDGLAHAPAGGPLAPAAPAEGTPAMEVPEASAVSQAVAPRTLASALAPAAPLDRPAVAQQPAPQGNGAAASAAPNAAASPTAPADVPSGLLRAEDGPGEFDDVPAWEEEAVMEASDFDATDDATFDGNNPQALFNAVADAAPAFAADRPRTQSPRLRDMNAKAWPALAAQLPLSGLAAELARQSEWLGCENDRVRLRVAVRTLAESPGKSRLCTVLSEHFGTVVCLDVEYGETGDETAHAVEQAQRALLQQEAERAVQADPLVQSLINDFGARVVPGSVQAAPVTPKAA